LFADALPHGSVSVLNIVSKIKFKQMSEEKTIPADQPVEGAKQAQKVPVFIGCHDPEIIKQIDVYITSTFNNSDLEYETVVMNRELFAKSCEVYALQMMSEEDRQRMKAINRDENQKNEARNIADYLHKIVDETEFTTHSLRTAINERRKDRLSNKRVEEMVQFCILHGTIELVDDTRKRHEWTYRIALNEEVRRTIYANRKKILEDKIETARAEIAFLQKEMNIDLPSEENTVKNTTVKAKKASKKSVKEGEQTAASDHINDRTSESVDKPKRGRKKKTDEQHNNNGQGADDSSAETRN
jgi:hypothetical protein